MEHPAALHHRSFPVMDHELSPDTSLESFEPCSNMEKFPLTRTFATQTDADDENIAAAADGFGFVDMRMAELVRSQLVDTRARQYDLNVGSADGLSPEGAQQVLLSLRALQPVDAAWPMTLYTHSYEEGNSSPTWRGESAGKLGSEGNTGRPRSSTCSQPLNGPRAGSSQICANCGVTETSMWRKEKGTNRTNCNACGLYFNTTGRYRNPNGKAMRSGVKKGSARKGKARTGGRRRIGSGRRNGGRPSETTLSHAAESQDEAELQVHQPRSGSPVLEVAPAPVPIATQTDNSLSNEGIPMQAPEVASQKEGEVAWHTNASRIRIKWNRGAPQPTLLPTLDPNPVPLPPPAASPDAGPSQESEPQISWSPLQQEFPTSYYHVMGQLGAPSFAATAVPCSSVFHPRLLGVSFQQ